MTHSHAYYTLYNEPIQHITQGTQRVYTSTHESMTVYALSHKVYALTVRGKRQACCNGQTTDSDAYGKGITIL